ncbi:MAG: hypothetical protein JW829_00110 [Pirellulales bacterium]|nr:hypothetical protein [Pirellulales bacterium]
MRILLARSDALFRIFMGAWWCSAMALCGVTCHCAHAQFDLVYSYASSAEFTTGQIQILDEALARTEAMWEGVITGYPQGISIDHVAIEIDSASSGLAAATYTNTIWQGGFRIATAGYIQVNPAYIESFSSGVDPEGHFNTGLNYMDELLAHETGHVLGIGSLWVSNGVYTNDTWTPEDPVGDYLGQYGLAGYQDEFDATATFVPVELAGGSGTANSHWDQRMRSSSQEGNPNDPWSLSPLTGITDSMGRDLGLELMTGAVDPDYNEPFLSRTTIQSMRDLGYTVTSPEDFNGDTSIDGADLSIWMTMFGTTGLEIDSFIYGDAMRDRTVDGNDFLAWQRMVHSGVPIQPIPEPASIVLLISILAAALARRVSVHFKHKETKKTEEEFFGRVLCFLMFIFSAIEF